MAAILQDEPYRTVLPGLVLWLLITSIISAGLSPLETKPVIELQFSCSYLMPAAVLCSAKR